MQMTDFITPAVTLFILALLIGFLKSWGRDMKHQVDNIDSKIKIAIHESLNGNVSMEIINRIAESKLVKERDCDREMLNTRESIIRLERALNELKSMQGVHSGQINKMKEGE